jgi:hypothetical protein
MVILSEDNHNPPTTGVVEERGKRPLNDGATVKVGVLFGYGFTESAAYAGSRHH